MQAQYLALLACAVAASAPSVSGCTGPGLEPPGNQVPNSMAGASATAGAGGLSGGTAGNVSSAGMGNPNMYAGAGAQPMTGAGSFASAGVGGGAPSQAGGGGTIANVSGAGGAGGMPTDPACGALAENPFECGFAWGTNDPGGPLATYGYLQFMSKWVGYEVTADGTIPRCDGCSWLTQQLASTELVPVYYAYFIGYLGHANGLPDGNEQPTGPNLTTGGAQLIRDQPRGHHRHVRGLRGAEPTPCARRAAGLAARGRPRAVHARDAGAAAFDGRARVAHGRHRLRDQVEDAERAGRDQPLDLELGPGHERVLGRDETRRVSYDLVWTTGVPNNDGFFESRRNAPSYNSATATYAYIRQLTGREILVDTSFGLSAMADSWSSAPAATLNARIADGVIGVNVATPPAGYQAAISGLAGQLDPVCE